MAESHEYRLLCDCVSCRRLGPKIRAERDRQNAGAHRRLCRELAEAGVESWWPMRQRFETDGQWLHRLGRAEAQRESDRLAGRLRAEGSRRSVNYERAVGR